MLFRSHREYTVGNYQFEAAIFGSHKLSLQVFHIGVGVAETLCLAQTHSVDDRGVVEGVGDDGVFLAEQRLEYTAVGVEASGIQDGVFHIEKLGDGFFECLVQVLRTTDKTNRCHTVTAFVHSLLGGSYEAWIVGETEVVVGAEVEHFVFFYADV